MTNCPESGATGRQVERITLDALLRPEHKSRIGSRKWFFCPDPDCTVAYFDAEGGTLDKSTLSVRIGAKEPDSPRPICYCFDHSFEEIEEEVAATGTSTIQDDITEKCRQGLHDCERKNPQGSCCLGNVRAASKEAQATDSSSTQVNDQDCCTAPPFESRTPASPSAGRLAAGGAVVSAVLSSACCWLPLVLLAFGASTAGVSGFFDRYRPVFLGTAAVLLSTGFYLVYSRKPACLSGDTCAVPNSRLMRVNKAMLWVATIFVATFALFPNYVGAFLGTDHVGDTVSTDRPYDLEFAIDGMTCEACAVTLRSKLSELPGVSTAEVLYSTGQARLRFNSPESKSVIDAIVNAVAGAGYKAVLLRPAD